jgi:transcriptional regulator with XRE-family HTH domain
LTIRLGNTARELRESLGLSQRQAAEALGITPVHLCNVEKNRAAPSHALIDKYRELWGVDLYVLAWCRHGDVHDLPHGVRNAATALADEWREQLAALGHKTVS